MSSAVTEGIRVEVKSAFRPDRSEPSANRWLFTYTVTIRNEGDVPAQLMARHWIITDANGDREEVQGDGVVGHQPRLSAGEQFEYTSFCPLETPFGTMEGHYNMVAADGSAFEATIAPFGLATPTTLN